MKEKYTLDGKTWLRNSVSIWSDIQKTKEEKALKHPAIFPSQLVERLIDCFTKPSDHVIFDPFVGAGGVIVGANNKQKYAIGCDIYQEYLNLIRSRIPSGYTLHLADSTKHCEPENSVDFVVTSPPYWDILSQKRTADQKEIRKYGDGAEDLGEEVDYNFFVNRLAEVFKNVFFALKPGKYCCVVVMDIRKKNKFYPFHMHVVEMMESLGFIFDDIIIWDRGKEYNNLRPLGYPYVFRVNKVHEFILIFKKPE